jgi:hypothetical protein
MIRTTPVVAISRTLEVRPVEIRTSALGGHHRPRKGQLQPKSRRHESVPVQQVWALPQRQIPTERAKTLPDG